jgi:hypothetical protein
MLRCPVSQVSALLAASAASELVLRDSVYQDDCFRAVLPLTGLPSPEATLSSLAARVSGLGIARDVGTVSLVGVGVGSDGSELASFLGALAAPPQLLVATPLRITAVVQRSAVDDAERALHARH